MQRLFVRSDRQIETAFGFVGHAEIVVGVRVGGLQRDGAKKKTDRLVEFFLLLRNEAEAVAGLRVVRRLQQRLIIFRFGAG